jgi:hypothetical protein
MHQSTFRGFEKKKQNSDEIPCQLLEILKNIELDMNITFPRTRAFSWAAAKKVDFLL